MKKREVEPPRQHWETVEYTDNPELPDPDQLVEISADFLPAPEALVFKNARRKITITLDQASIDFFKAEAERLHVPYQRMIRNLLTEYVSQQRNKNSPTAA